MGVRQSLSQVLTGPRNVFRKVPSILRVRTPPGTWSAAVEPVWDPGTKEPRIVKTAICVCPACDRPFSLVNHRISEQGRPSPSVVCPHPGCSYHEMVVLEGWTP